LRIFVDPELCCTTLDQNGIALIVSAQPHGLRKNKRKNRGNATGTYGLEYNPPKSKLTKVKFLSCAMPLSADSNFAIEHSISAKSK
jgi:hypothetical protein